MFKWISTFIIICSGCSSLFGDSFANALNDKTGELDILWYTSTPFLYRDSKGHLTGMEYDIVVSFQDFLKEKYALDIQLNWKEATSFHSILDTVSKSSQPNLWGVSAFSITEERQRLVKYTASYLPDITVLVSSEGTPIVRNFDEIDQFMNGMKAITIEGTVYEQFLFDIKKQLNVDFEMDYIHSDQNVLDIISQNENTFGFIDMLVYMIWIKNGSALTRQNFFTIRGIGYGFIMPKNSDWDEPFEAFLEDPKYKTEVEEIIKKYIGAELYEFIDNLYEGEPLGTSILTKEKEIQLALIKNANLRLQEGEAFRNVLLIGIIGAMLLLLVIGFVLFSNHRTTRILMTQKSKIEAQQKDINQKNEQLLNRNAKLRDLNEEKNNLVRILAHDLRAPLGNITGLIGLMNSSVEKMNDDEKKYFGHITDASKRMADMINKILDVDVLEENKKLVFLEQVSVDELVRDLTQRYRPIAAQKSINFIKSVSKKNCIIETDHMLLFLVLENLISNAIKFSPPNSNVSLNVTCDADEITFKVSDEGPGFTDDDKMKLFGRFQKLSAQPTGNETSSGLGLSIVKKYVTELGGKVWLESEVGQGSTFYVSLHV